MLSWAGSWGARSCSIFPARADPSLHPAAYPDLKSYTVRVVSTDYNQFAMVFFKAVLQDKENFKITLYGGSSPTLSGTQLLVTLEGFTPTQPISFTPSPGEERGLSADPP